MKKVRNVVNTAIEEKRAKKIIGSSLEANLKIYMSQEYLNLFENINLPEYFITSSANCEQMKDIKDLFKLENLSEIGVEVIKSEGKKCPRCWKILKNSCERNNCGLKN
jgi:isoleucyl-tRNA synthetase